MNKRMREILQQIEEKKAAAKDAKDVKDFDKAAGIMDEIDELKKEYDLEARMVDNEKDAAVEDFKPVEGQKDAIKAFADAARHNFKDYTGLQAGVGADGGYTVPQEIQTKIEELKDPKASLRTLVADKKVKTATGSETYKKRSQIAGFVSVEEAGKFPALAAPTFSKLDWAVKKYAGYLPATNELLADSDANIVSVITSWIADEARVTENRLIIEALKSKGPVLFSGIDGIKKALNIDLGQAFKGTARIITNDDGLQYLDTLKYDDGKYLMSSPVDPMQLSLSAGATTVPITVVPNGDLPTAADTYVKTNDKTVVSGKTYYTLSGTTYTAVSSPAAASLDTYYEKINAIPFFVGDLKEGIKVFDRAATQIKVSDAASVTGFNAFEQDLTLYRASLRLDVKVRDEQAFVYGCIAA